MVTASPLTQMRATAFEGMLLAPLDRLSLTGPREYGVQHKLAMPPQD